jgi:translation initiation factor IF-2
MVSVKRGKKVVHEGKLSSLRRVKDLVEEVKEGLECGVGVDGFLDWSVGDVMECYQVGV